MRIGVRGHDYGCADAREMARRISDAGFGCLQLALHKAITGFKPEYGHLSPGFCREIKLAFEARGLFTAVLGCYIDPANQSEAVRSADVKRFCEQVTYCRMLGSDIVATETSSCNEANRDRQYEFLLDSIRKMTSQAEKSGVFVGVEPVSVHTLNTPSLAAKLLSDVSSCALQIVLDPINLLSPRTIANQHYIIDECFDLLSDRIVAVHAKDVLIKDGTFVPCVIGDGLFDHEYFYKKLNRAKPGIAILREEAIPETASRDITALKHYSEL